MPLAVPLARRVARLAPAHEAVRDGADAEVPAAAREASAAALDRGETHYTDRPGIMPLRQKVAERLSSRYGVDVDAAKGVVITCGVTEARFVAIQQLVASGSGTVVALSHPERVAGACVVRDVRLAGPDDHVQGHALVYLGADTPAERRDAWLSRAKEQGWPVVFEAGEGGWHPAAAGLAEQTVTIGPLGLGEGLEAWRIGYLAAPSATAGPLRDFKQALTLCTTNLSQWGALALMEEGA
jgi:N-succinyldiaminopimelate aminotransferase